MKKKNIKNIRKEQAACIAAGILLAVVSAFSGGTKDLVRSGETVTILRPGYGEADRKQTVRVNGEEVSFTVTGRKYTEEEAEKILSRLADAILSSEAAGQKSVYEGYEGVRAEWSEGESGPICRLTARTEQGTAEKVLVMCADDPSGEPHGDAASFEERVREALGKADADSVTKAAVTLPGEADGVKLSYGEKRNLTPAILLLLGIVSAFLLGKKPEEERKKQQKARETELLLDYSDVVSKLLIYLGAGLTVRNAFGRLCKTEAGPKRAAYEELSAAVRDMENGISEEEALSAFASRCGLACYVRLASLLERNQKTGGNAVRAELELEMQEAFSQRKETAKRLGEEAGTRLVVPLMMSLFAVLLTTAVPAFLKMQM